MLASSSPQNKLQKVAHGVCTCQSYQNEKNNRTKGLKYSQKKRYISH